MRRLTRKQYNNTVRDLLGIKSTPAVAFSPDERDNDFETNAGAPLTELQLEQYQQAGEELAHQAAGDIKALAPCAPPAAAEESDCAEQLIRQLGQRAYRRPLETSQLDRYRKVFAIGRSGADFASGARLVLQALLQSPRFLYRVELGAASPAGTGADGVPLDAYEIASRLSYFIWNTMPDDRLFAAAGAGRLGTADEVAAETRRMLKDRRAGDMLATFHEQWLGVEGILGTEKSAQLFPMFDRTLREAMREETIRFVHHVILDSDGRIETLLTGGFSFLSGPLYSFYGMPAPSAARAAGWQRIDLPAGQRAGLLTMPGVLAVHSHVDQTSLVQRGLMIRAKLLCTVPPPPPPNVNNAPPKVDPNVSARRRFEQHRANAACAGCHRLMDPLGAPFEIFDAIGRYRTMDGKQRVDSSGELVGTVANDGPVSDPVELAHRLAAADEVRGCIARQWFRFAFARKEAADDAGTLAIITDAFRASDFKIPELLVALTRSKGFRYRQALALQ